MRKHQTDLSVRLQNRAMDAQKGGQVVTSLGR
jgi:hypothetical protein